MINNTELEKEKKYLLDVLSILDKQIKSNTDKLQNYNKDIKSLMEFTWDNDNQADNNFWAENMRILETNSITASDIVNKIRVYSRMIKSAYFARIDFETDGEVIPVYLGIASLIDNETFYIYDWRAPISSMFYDYEKGEAEYVTPDGVVVKGKIILKRQYKIEGDKIVQIFDTDMQIVDSILKDMLQNNTSEKMRNIVNTIQKEQNKIIRKKDVDILIVEGPAGSGKTSVAMHKIAYLLYAERKSLSNNNILIISPNEIFSNYISNVLPEIGEDNVYQSTFINFIKNQIDYKVINTMNDIYERVYSEDNNEKHTTEYNSIMLKYGALYINLIETYLSRNKSKILNLKDIELENYGVVLDKSYIEKLADGLDFGGASLQLQGKRLLEKIVLHLTMKLNNQKNMFIQDYKKSFEENLSKINSKLIFLDLYSNEKQFVEMVEEIYKNNPAIKNKLTRSEIIEVFRYTKDLLMRNSISFEDIAGYLYLKDRIHGSSAQSTIKYVFIDEAQDYTVMQYKILAHIFRKAKIVILGDINQSIMPFATHQNYETILNLLKQDRPGVRCDTSYLTKTYRSTYEINTFCKQIISNNNTYNQVDRHGDEVEVIKNANDKKIFEDAINLKKKYNSVAIITKNQAEANELYSNLQTNAKIADSFKLLNGNEKVFSASKILIVPSYLAKGLEFDVVLVYDASDSKYDDNNKNLFYVVCTRALHKLNVYYKDKLTPLIKNAKTTL